MIEFKMPSLGADMEAGTLCEWLVKPGDKVKRGDIIAIVDTQKGLIDIEVFDSGTIDQLILKENEKVPVGTVMAMIRSDHEVPEITKPLELPKEATSKAPIEKPLEVKTPSLFHAGLKASPLARKRAQEAGIDLTLVQGSGEGGAITRDDVEKAIGQKVEKAKTTAGTGSIRKAVAAAMSLSNREIPHYYLFLKVDMRKSLAWLTELNRQRSVKLRLLPVTLLIKAVALALREVPELNGYYEEGLNQKNEINPGFVISLRTGGLMIPALHEADKKSLDEVMQWLNEIIPRARALNLRSSDLSDSTITITSLGENNAEAVFGVIYPPQVALVGLGSIIEQPWAENGMLDVRPALTLSLAADHRATDGQTGSRFLMAVNRILQNPEAL